MGFFGLGCSGLGIVDGVRFFFYTVQNVFCACRVDSESLHELQIQIFVRRSQISHAAMAILFSVVRVSFPLHVSIFLAS